MKHWGGAYFWLDTLYTCVTLYTPFIVLLYIFFLFRALRFSWITFVYKYYSFSSHTAFYKDMSFFFYLAFMVFSYEGANVHMELGETFSLDVFFSPSFSVIVARYCCYYFTRFSSQKKRIFRTEGRGPFLSPPPRKFRKARGRRGVEMKHFSGEYVCSYTQDMILDVFPSLILCGATAARLL